VQSRSRSKARIRLGKRRAEDQSRLQAYYRLPVSLPVHAQLGVLSYSCQPSAAGLTSSRNLELFREATSALIVETSELMVETSQTSGSGIASSKQAPRREGFRTSVKISELC